LRLFAGDPILSLSPEAWRQSDTNPQTHQQMNRYLLFTRSGQAYAVSANFSHDAIAKVETHARERVSCWFIGEKIPSTAISLN
jgi:hypothetical protein